MPTDQSINDQEDRIDIFKDGFGIELKNPITIPVSTVRQVLEELKKDREGGN